jgi:hypothetical protein
MMENFLLLRYASLAVRWWLFYRRATPTELLKDVKYSASGRSLDVYLRPSTFGPVGRAERAGIPE